METKCAKIPLDPVITIHDSNLVAVNSENESDTTITMQILEASFIFNPLKTNH